MSDEARESAKEKIAKLMAMAKHERSNETEAETALRHAEALMRKHGIELAELEASTGKKTVYNWVTKSVPVRVPKPIFEKEIWFEWLMVSIGKFADCKVGYYESPQFGLCASYTGDETDVEYAVWLTKNIRDSAVRESRDYQAFGDTNEVYRQKEDFRRAMIRRLNQRMDILRDERDEALQLAVTSSGTALMVVNEKIAQRNEQFGEQKYSNRPSRAQMRMSQSVWAARAGREAGDRVSLTRPLPSNETNKVLK